MAVDEVLVHHELILVGRKSGLSDITETTHSILHISSAMSATGHCSAVSSVLWLLIWVVSEDVLLVRLQLLLYLVVLNLDRGVVVGEADVLKLRFVALLAESLVVEAIMGRNLHSLTIVQIVSLLNIQHARVGLSTHVDTLTLLLLLPLRSRALQVDTLDSSLALSELVFELRPNLPHLGARNDHTILLLPQVSLLCVEDLH